MSIYTNSATSSPEEIRSYVGALLELLGDARPLAVLARTEAELKQRVSGVSADRMTQAEAPGKWSVRHVLQHLADSELVWGFRLRMILTQERPPLAGYDQDAFAERLRYDLANAEEALAEFGVLRHGNVRLLERATDEDLRRVAVHAERGEESLAHMMRLYAGHDLLHLRQIDRILKSVS
jgi:uncharacterized damage-inducible protein DinB